jgi:hypothetical protein
MKNQQMSLFKFYSYIDGSLHVSGLEAHPQENSHSCSHNHWFSGCVNSIVNSPKNGPVGPKHVEIRRYMYKKEIIYIKEIIYMKIYIVSLYNSVN